MLALNIKIVDRNDPPPFPDLTEDQVVRVEIADAIILQGGMDSGKASVAFFAKLPDGKTVMMETSAAILDNFHAATVGSRMRWGEIQGRV